MPADRYFGRAEEVLARIETEAEFDTPGNGGRMNATDRGVGATSTTTEAKAEVKRMGSGLSGVKVFSATLAEQRAR